MDSVQLFEASRVTSVLLLLQNMDRPRITSLLKPVSETKKVSKVSASNTAVPRALCKIKLLPVTHVLVDTWMLTVKPVYKLSNVVVI